MGRRWRPDICEAGQFTIAGWLEPAASEGVDTFDYTLDRDPLHVSITDAVGHEIEAALLATLFVGGLCNARRKGLDLDAQARHANDTLAENADGRVPSSTGHGSGPKLRCGHRPRTTEPARSSTVGVLCLCPRGDVNTCPKLSI
jgi:hypothetical protein